VINPGSVILSGVMLAGVYRLEGSGKNSLNRRWKKTILQKFVTYDFERQTVGATKVGTANLQPGSSAICNDCDHWQDSPRGSNAQRSKHHWRRQRRLDGGTLADGQGTG